MPEQTPSPLAIAGSCTKSEVLRKAIALYDVAFEAKLQKKRLGILDPYRYTHLFSSIKSKGCSLLAWAIAYEQASSEPARLIQNTAFRLNFKQNSMKIAAPNPSDPERKKMCITICLGPEQAAFDGNRRSLISAPAIKKTTHTGNSQRGGFSTKRSSAR